MALSWGADFPSSILLSVFICLSFNIFTTSISVYYSEKEKEDHVKVRKYPNANQVVGARLSFLSYTTLCSSLLIIHHLVFVGSIFLAWVFTLQVDPQAVGPPSEMSLFSLTGDLLDIIIPHTFSTLISQQRALLSGAFKHPKKQLHLWLTAIQTMAFIIKVLPYIIMPPYLLVMASTIAPHLFCASYILIVATISIRSKLLWIHTKRRRAPDKLTYSLYYWIAPILVAHAGFRGLQHIHEMLPTQIARHISYLANIPISITTAVDGSAFVFSLLIGLHDFNYLV